MEFQTVLKANPWHDQQGQFTDKAHDADGKPGGQHTAESVHAKTTLHGGAGGRYEVRHEGKTIGELTKLEKPTIVHTAGGGATSSTKIVWQASHKPSGGLDTNKPTQAAAKASIAAMHAAHLNKTEADAAKAKADATTQAHEAAKANGREHWKSEDYDKALEKMYSSDNREELLKQHLKDKYEVNVGPTKDKIVLVPSEAAMGGGGRKHAFKIYNSNRGTTHYELDDPQHMVDAMQKAVELYKADHAKYEEARSAHYKSMQDLLNEKRLRHPKEG